jgi:plastocyanin
MIRPLVSMAVALLLGSEARAQAGGSVHGKVTGADGAQTVVVYVEKVAGAKSTKRKAVMAQKNQAFSPAAMVVTAGTRVEMPNRDKVFHNAFSLTPGNEFDLGLYRGGEARTVDLSQPGEVDVFCNIHPDMVAKVLVLQNDFFAELTPGQPFRISGIPAGSYTLVAWTAEHKPVRKTVTITADKPTEVDFELTPRSGSKVHLNKHGEAYGRYK